MHRYRQHRARAGGEGEGRGVGGTSYSWLYVKVLHESVPLYACSIQEGREICCLRIAKIKLKLKEVAAKSRHFY